MLQILVLFEKKFKPSTSIFLGESRSEMPFPIWSPTQSLAKILTHFCFSDTGLTISKITSDSCIACV